VTITHPFIGDPKTLTKKDMVNVKKMATTISDLIEIKKYENFRSCRNVDELEKPQNYDQVMNNIMDSVYWESLFSDTRHKIKDFVSILLKNEKEVTVRSLTIAKTKCFYNGCYVMNIIPQIKLWENGFFFEPPDTWTNRNWNVIIRSGKKFQVILNKPVAELI
jgi:hypothetical protein